MDFEQLLDRLWGFDAEIFAHDSLFVFISYRSGERVVFHNCEPNKIQEFIDKYNPILIGYNCNHYDKWILKCWLAGYNPEELKDVNDYIIGGGNGWDIDCGYVEVPTMWDLFNEINPRKSLKEIEGNLRLDITETTVPFDLPTKWTDEQYEEVVFYCTADVNALFPLFDKLKNGYKSKYIIAKFGNIDPEYALSQTNANLTAILLGAERKEYDDNFIYTYPSCIDKSKIPQEALDYFDDVIAHNDLDYNPPAPELELKDILFQIGLGGGHGFKKTGVYYYDRNNSKKVLCNWDFTSLYPNLVRLFGYSSRSQSDKDGYVGVLKTRMDAKKGLLGDDFLGPMGLTNKELNIGLKLPLNAYTGALRAKFNKLYDNLQGFSICTTGQLIVLQLIHDLEKVPTLEMVSANTDAVMYEVSAEYKDQADEIIHNLEKVTGLEMEEDNIVRIIMANVNNYCELLQTGENSYAINYKGGRFQFNSIEKNLKMIWDKENNKWDTIFDDDVKTNSLTIVGEALLKRLLLDIPVEKTINECDDIFRFQIISHLGSTYEKCVQESLDYSNELVALENKRDELLGKMSENAEMKVVNVDDNMKQWSEGNNLHYELQEIEGQITNLKNLSGKDIELQRNNRIYAGKVPSGAIIKIKPDGRRDSLADCPPNPIVDNGNKLTIDDINKEWYIEIAKQRVDDFLGVKRLEEYKKDELLELAKELNINVDKKTKKDRLIEIIKEVKRGGNQMATKQELEEKLEKSVEQNEKLIEKMKEDPTRALYHKINEFRKEIRKREFIFDGELPNNLGGKEYYHIDQFYNAIQDVCVSVGLDFSFELVEIISFEKELVKPSGKLPIHVATVKSIAKLTDIDTGISKEYITIGQGSDTIDKAISGANTSAFRQWFYKNFTPRNMDEEELDKKEEVVKSEAPKVPVFIPETKKEVIKKEVVEESKKATEVNGNEDIKRICDNIMKIRNIEGCEDYGTNTMTKLMSGTLSDAEVMRFDLIVQNKMEKVGIDG